MIQVLTFLALLSVVPVISHPAWADENSDLITAISREDVSKVQEILENPKLRGKIKFSFRSGSEKRTLLRLAKATKNKKMIRLISNAARDSRNPSGTESWVRRAVSFLTQVKSYVDESLPFQTRSQCEGSETAINLPLQEGLITSKKKGLILEQIDLASHPEQLTSHDQTEELTVGDLHGNSIKLLNILIREDILELSPDPEVSRALYLELAEIYEKGGFDRKGIPDLLGLDRYSDILKNAKIKENGPKLRLLGDELADRGKNDYFTLKIFEKLHQNQVPLEILASNHGYFFLRYFEDEVLGGRKFIPLESRGSLTSFIGLQSLLDHKTIRENTNIKNEVIQMVQDSYLPYLKPLSYSVDNEGVFSFHSHAPVGFEAVHAMAAELNLDCGHEKNLVKSRRRLMSCIDRINEKFEDVKKLNQISNQFRKNPDGALFYTTFNRYGFNMKLNRPEVLADGTRVKWHVGLGKNGLFFS